MFWLRSGGNAVLIHWFQNTLSSPVVLKVLPVDSWCFELLFLLYPRTLVLKGYLRVILAI